MAYQIPTFLPLVGPFALVRADFTVNFLRLTNHIDILKDAWSPVSLRE